MPNTQGPERKKKEKKRECDAVSARGSLPPSSSPKRSANRKKTTRRSEEAQIARKPKSEAFTITASAREHRLQI